MQIQISWLPLIWLYTICKDRVYPGSAGQGLKKGKSLYWMCVYLWRNCLFAPITRNVFLLHLRSTINIICSKYLPNPYLSFGQYIYQNWHWTFRRIVGIPTATNWTPLIVDLLLFCYEIDFMLSLSLRKIKLIYIETFNSTSKYQENLLWPYLFNWTSVK